MAKLSARELAEQYGFAYAFLRSDKSIWNLFQKAVKGNWDVAKFTAKLKTTSWYKKNSESARQYLLLKKSDPATFRARTSEVKAQIQDRAIQMGAVMSDANMNRVVQHALMFGWNDSQIMNALGGYVKAVNGIYHGQAANDAETIREKAWRNGIRVGSATIGNWVQDIAQGKRTQSELEAYIRKQAENLAPHFADELRAGMDLYDIAQPYMQSMSQALELNPADVDLFDPTIRNALYSRSADGKPMAKSLWQFEQDVKSDPRWLKTKNAQDSVMATGRQVLKDFGFKF